MSSSTPTRTRRNERDVKRRHWITERELRKAIRCRSTNLGPDADPLAVLEADAAATLEKLRAEADQAAVEARAALTKRAYAADRRDVSAFCVRIGRDSRDIIGVTGQRSSGIVPDYVAAATLDDDSPLLEIVGAGG